MAISPLTGSSSFYDWYVKTNDEIIAQLNAMTIYGATSGDGVRMDVNGSGILTGTIGGTSGNIKSGLTFSGKVDFTGEAVVPNISFKIYGITSGSSGYTFGSVIRTNGINGYTLACADNPDNAESLAVISAMNSTYSVASMLGKITGNFNTVAGGTLFSGCIYFLDPTNPGKITTTEPVTVGQVSKPVIMGLSGDTGIILQYRGNYLNGTSTLGLSGNNRIYVILPSSSSSNGFTPGAFVSYLPNVGTKDALFDAYLVGTGRTAYDGWFVSQSSSSTVTSPLPFEEDFVVGMIETSMNYGSDKLYQVVTRGASEIVPTSITPSVYGWWTLNGVTLPQLTQSSNNIEENNPYERLYVGYNYNNTSFVVDIKPQIRSISSNRSTTISTSAQNISTFNNETFNGDYSIWQRSTGRDSQYTSNVSKVYFADQWVRRTSRTSLVSQYLQRQSFSKTQTTVEGSPQYYVDVKCVVDPSSIWFDGHHSVGHILPNIEALNNSDITVSFYAKCSHSNYSFNVYLARYNGSTLVSKTTIGTVNPTTSWDKYVINYTVPALSAGSYSDDYVEIGFDIEPTVKTAFDASVSLGTNLFMSFASLCVYNGTYLNPKHLFDSDESKALKANKYYYTTYTGSQIEGSATLATNGGPALNAHDITYVPNSNYSLIKLPVRMRKTPTITTYSPVTGALNDAFNVSAGLDLRQTSGTIGYDRKTRIAPLNLTTISSTSDETNVKLTLVNGIVPYDVVSCHVIADASYPL